MSEGESNEVLVERLLMKFDEIPDRDKFKVNVFLVDIEGVGAWVVKFRKSGVIINNRDLIINVNVDATISFKTASSFFRVMDGGSTISDEIGKGKLSLHGPTEALESFHMKWLRICDLPNTVNADAPIRQHRFVSMDTSTLRASNKALKSGWLLKKRDIFSGWRCRYFVVYPDRLEYFVDQSDATPKATFSLADVEVQPVKRVNMPGTGEHWGFIVTTKNPKTTFRLASEMLGMEGMVECSTWEKVFNVARNCCAQHVDSIVTDSDVAKFRRQEDVRSTVEALARSAAGAKAAAKSGTPRDGAENKAAAGWLTFGTGWTAGWVEYATSKQGAPRLLLFLGLAVLVVRIAWNVTKIRQVLRSVVFHGLVAVVLVLILFFLKSVFVEYFAADDDCSVDTTASFSTIMSSRLSPGKGLTPPAPAAVQAQGQGQGKGAVAASKAAGAKVMGSAPAKAVAAPAVPSPPIVSPARTTAKTSTANGNNGSKASSAVPVSGLSAPVSLGPSATSATGAHYGCISPLPPHVITSRPSADGGVSSVAHLASALSSGSNSGTNSGANSGTNSASSSIRSPASNFGARKRVSGVPNTSNS